jgi:hypothetical protein|tara:strand:+ start:132 stop:296 length:165 start_codon:yes stop_codon:yes gene_type:complete
MKKKIKEVAKLASGSSSMAAGMDKQIKTAKSAGPVTQSSGAAATKKQRKSLLMR